MAIVEIHLTSAEAKHLKELMGKDIAWQLKYGTGKEGLAKSIYEKVKRAMEGKN